MSKELYTHHVSNDSFYLLIPHLHFRMRFPQVFAFFFVFEMMLRGQLALITGGSSGIGAATAKVFVQHGAKVVIVGRNEARLAAVAESLDNASYIVGDITEDGALPNVVSSAVDTLGGLTSLVNCAGVLGGGAMGTPACNLANFDFNFNVNVRAAFEAMTLYVLLLYEHTLPVEREFESTTSPPTVCFFQLFQMRARILLAGLTRHTPPLPSLPLPHPLQKGAFLFSKQLTGRVPLSMFRL